MAHTISYLYRGMIPYCCCCSSYRKSIATSIPIQIEAPREQVVRDGLMRPEAGSGHARRNCVFINSRVTPVVQKVLGLLWQTTLLLIQQHPRIVYIAGMERRVHPYYLSSLRCISYLVTTPGWADHSAGSSPSRKIYVFIY